ncbi:MAG: putative glycoside hydrolase [Angelakisella sp.]
MPKRYKVRRYGYEWGGQRKQWWQKTATTILMIVLAAGIGWFAYEPVYNLVMNMGNGPSNLTPSSVPPTSQSAPPSSVPENPVPESTPQPESSGLPEVLYYLPEATIQNKDQLSAALAEIKAKGGTGVLFDLKNETGVVLYNSTLPIVTKNLALAVQPYNLGDVTAAIQAAGLTPVGRLFAFKDTTSTASMTEGAVKYMDSKVNWLDNAKADGGKAWLNPNSPISRDYILQLVDETTAAGLDYLVLDGVQFPTGLSLQLATYGGTPDKSAVLADFLTTAQQHAEKNGAAVYPVIGLDAAAGVNAVPYGTNPEKLIAATGRAVLDIRPEQFGIGITTEKLILTKPLLTPYETVKTALTAAEAVLGQEGAELTALVQSYTSTKVEGASNKPYGAEEAAEQHKAASEAGIGKVLYYNPAGQY